MLDRNTLIEEYASRIVEGMDMDDMYNFIYDTLVERLDDYTDNDLVNEVAEYYPDLVETDDAEA
jgi:hypothetical protein